MVDDDPRLKVTLARRILAREGCESQVAGHVSVRVPGEDAFWVTPFEYFDETLPDRVIKASFDLELLEGSWVPSRAIRFHAGFYRARPDVGSVIHIHSHYTSVLATTGRPLGMYNDASALFYDDQVIHVDPEGFFDVDRMIEEVGDDKNTVIVKNHGAVLLAPSLEVATILAATFERCAKYHVEAEKIGGTEHLRTYYEKGAQGYRRHYLPEMWAANVRRLQLDEPELFVQEASSV